MASKARFPLPEAVQDFEPGKKALLAALSLHVVSNILVDMLIEASVWQVIAVAPTYIFMFFANTVPVVAMCYFFCVVLCVAMFGGSVTTHSVTTTVCFLARASSAILLQIPAFIRRCPSASVCSHDHPNKNFCPYSSV